MISPELGILNQLGTPMFNSDTFANRPNFGIIGRIFIATDTKEFYRDTGTTWELIGGPGSGTITGLGTPTQVAFFDNTGSISSDINLFWDDTNKRLGIGTNTPSATLDAHGQNIIVQLNGISNTNSQIQFKSNDVAKWNIGNIYSGGSNYFRIRDDLNSVERLKIENTGLSTFVGNLTNVLTKTAISNDGWYGIFSNDEITIPSGISFTGGNAFGSLNGANKMLFLGNATFSNASVAGGIISSNIFTFQNAGSVIQNTQPPSGTRTIAAITAFNQVNSVNNGTVNWLSGLQVLAPYTANSGTLYVGNYFGLLLNASDERTAFNISYKWGVYQEGQNDINYFRSKVLIGSNVDQLNGALQVSGAGTFSSSVTASSFIKSGGTATQYLMANGSTTTLTNPVTGTGTSGQVAFWNGTNSQTGSNNLVWDNTNETLTIKRNTSGGSVLEVFAINGLYNAMTVSNSGTTLRSAGSNPSLTANDFSVSSAGVGIRGRNPNYLFNIFRASSPSVASFGIFDGGTSTPHFVVPYSGNVLIGTITDNLTDLLQVAGSVRVNAGSSGSAITASYNANDGGINSINSGTLAANRTAQIRLTNGSTFFGANDRTYQLINIGTSSTASDFLIQYWNGSTYAERMRIKPNTINFSSLPTSSSGLSAGDLWNDGGTIKIV